MLLRAELLFKTRRAASPFEVEAARPKRHRLGAYDGSAVEEQNLYSTGQPQNQRGWWKLPRFFVLRIGGFQLLPAGHRIPQTGCRAVRPAVVSNRYPSQQIKGMSMAKPHVFIGSSIKGLDIARHAQAELEHDADAEIWTHAVFKSPYTPIENLLRLIEDYDFALFILHPEDKATIRNEDEVIVRDNVIFEMGLFLAKLGRSRVFFIAPQQPDRTHRDRLYLPTDLSGITPPEYNPSARNVRASVATSLDEFRRALNAYSSRGTIIDTERDFQPHHFVGSASYEVWDKDKPLDTRGEGTLDVLAANKAIRINRTNYEGRYEVAYLPYDKEDWISFRKIGDRRFHVKFKARAEGGKHKIRIVLKNVKANKWLGSQTNIVEEGKEQEFEFYLTGVPASANVLVRLDDLGIERVPSSVTISSFWLREIT